LTRISGGKSKLWVCQAKFTAKEILLCLRHFSFVLSQRAGQTDIGTRRPFCVAQHSMVWEPAPSGQLTKPSAVEETLLAPGVAGLTPVQHCARPPQLLPAAGRARQLGCSSPLLHAATREVAWITPGDSLSPRHPSRV